MQRCVLALHAQNLLLAAHDTSEGGLAVALAECAIVGDCGATLDREAFDALRAANDGRLDRALFGEAGSRVIVAIDANDGLANAERIAAEHGLTLFPLGRTGGDTLTVGDLTPAPVAALRAAWEGGLARARG